MEEKTSEVERIRLYPQPYDEMSKAELKMEYFAHAWLVAKIEEAVRRNSMRLHHMRTELPTDEMTREGVIADYENGLIDKRERRRRLRTIADRETKHLRTEAQIVFGQTVADHFRAVAVELNERLKDIADKERYNLTTVANYKESQIRSAKSRSKYKAYKNKSIYNRAPWHEELPPRQKKKLRPAPKVNGVQKKWSKSTYADLNYRKKLEHIEPLKTFDKDKLYAVAYDRGYMTRQTATAAMAEALGVPIARFRNSLYYGRLSWPHMLVIAGLFQMTPAEFCDVFMKGLFVEVVDGKWVAALPEEYIRIQGAAEKATR